MKYIGEIIDLIEPKLNGKSKLSEEEYKNIWIQSQNLLNKLLRNGIIPRIGEELIGLNSDNPISISNVCYSEHKIMFEAIITW